MFPSSCIGDLTQGSLTDSTEEGREEKIISWHGGLWSIQHNSDPPRISLAVATVCFPEISGLCEVISHRC